VHEGEGLREVFERVGPLNPACIIADGPFWYLLWRAYTSSALSGGIPPRHRVQVFSTRAVIVMNSSSLLRPPHDFIQQPSEAGLS
jgi:hypothetical protein